MEFLIKKAKLQAVSVKWLPTQSISRPIDIQIQRVQWKLYYEYDMYACMRKSVIGQQNTASYIFKAGGPAFFSIFKMADPGKEMLHVLGTPLWLFKWFAAGGPLGFRGRRANQGPHISILCSTWLVLEEFLTSAFNLVLGWTRTKLESKQSVWLNYKNFELTKKWTVPN